MDASDPIRSTPELSVVVPTYGRPERVEALLANLAAQTLEPSRFEVVVVDDGSPEPIEAPDPGPQFALRLLRQFNAGPGAARNRAFEHCRAPLVLILNDDAIPAPDLLAGHLAAHAEAPPRTAVLGSFPFSKQALRRPFVKLLQGSDLLFDFLRLRHGGLHDWRFFWTCNISLPLEALRQVGGFDAERFPEAIVEDVELGYRLEALGWKVLYREDLRCEHDHEMGAADWFARMVRLGVNLYRMAEKHGDWSVVGFGTEVDREAFLQRCQIQFERGREACEHFVSRLDQLDARYRDSEIPSALATQVRGLVRKLGAVPYGRGVVCAATGHDPQERIRAGAPRGELTSVVIVSHDGLERTRRCLEALRGAREEAHPIEILVVDNGSTDGSAEFLAAQPDVQLIRNDENRGAPHARNQAIALARGSWLAFLDNDALVSPGWLGRMLWHGAVDPLVGCVCPMSDRAAHGQQIPYDGGSSPAEVAAFAARRALEHSRQGLYKTIFTSFCVLVRRDVVDRIGGFDARFSPWGFEDDDFSLRVRLAGFRSRLALDVFVRHEAYGSDAAKADRHAKLLSRNWDRFVEKWGRGAAPAYGEYAFLEPVFQRTWDPRDLFVPLPESPAGGLAGLRRGRVP